MLFNTLQFFVFFTIVYTLYLNLSHKGQNRILLGASYLFYGAWDWRFLSLLLFSTLLDYVCAMRIQGSKDHTKKKMFLFFSVLGNLSVLGFFKYYNFFSAGLASLLSYLGFRVEPLFLDILLPVGISFYTFQTMSYTIDVYRGKISPTRRFLDFALFVAFFPQLVAGPIERAAHLLPQVLGPRQVTLSKFYEGSSLIFWGLFQKVVIADNLAKLVDPVFRSEGPYYGLQVLLTAYAFAFQIFCDFAGYSNIARGLGKCMGFDIMINFRCPYFSSNPRDFWRRWHMSLSTWLRDYLYITLGGNKRGKVCTVRNIVVTMLLGGLWHGAAWTFVLWGAYHALLIVAHRAMSHVLGGITVIRNSAVRCLWNGIKIFCFFHLVCFGWLIFRAQSMRQVGELFYALVFNCTFAVSQGFMRYSTQILFFTWLLIVIEFAQWIKDEEFVIFRSCSAVRVLFYVVCFWFFIIFGVVGGEEFIYFQF